MPLKKDMLESTLAKLKKLDPEQRISFYEHLAFRLTISVRAIWSEELILADEKVSRIKWINEIMHGVISKMRHLRMQTNNWSDEDSIEDIRNWVAQNPAIESDIEFAVRSSLELAEKAV